MLFRSNPQTLIIDNIGMLATLYRVASVTYVGGGFNSSGIHNCLEAAVYGKPVIFGPHFQKFAEARNLVESGAAFSISDKDSFGSKLSQLLSDKTMREKCGNIAADYVKKNAGATECILGHIRKISF